MTKEELMKKTKTELVTLLLEINKAKNIEPDFYTLIEGYTNSDDAFEEVHIFKTLNEIEEYITKRIIENDYIPITILQGYETTFKFKLEIKND